MKRLSASIALVSFFAALLIGIFSASPERALAASSDNMSGWAWSSNIGWISFNCTNESSCGTSNYGVNVDGSGNITGYAWSSNIGWIQFGGLSGFPTGSGTQTSNAQINGNNLKGWARALSNGGGWDGWISLSGAGPNYGVTLSGTTFSGYAWGGDVVGWVLFDVDTQYPGVCTGCGVSLSGDATLDVKSGGSTIVGAPAVPYGTIPTFEWTLTNLPVGTSCSVSKTSGGGTSFSTVSGITSSGSISGSALTNASYTYNISCVSGVTTIVNKNVSFTVAPQPAGFGLGNAEQVRIQILPSGAADSETKAVFVTAVGGYSNPVSISISSYPSLPASTTMQYSFNSGTSYSSNPGTTIISSPYSSGIGFKVRVTRQTGAPPFTSNYTVTLQASGSGATTVYKDMIITPTSTTPSFIEI